MSIRRPDPNDWAAKRKAKIEQAKLIKEERLNNLVNQEEYTFAPQINKRPGYLTDSAKANEQANNNNIYNTNDPFEKPLPGKTNYSVESNNNNNNNYNTNNKNNLTTLRDQTENFKSEFMQSLLSDEQQPSNNNSYNTNKNKDSDELFSNMLRGGDGGGDSGWNNDTTTDGFGEPVALTKGKRIPRPRADNNNNTPTKPPSSKPPLSDQKQQWNSNTIDNTTPRTSPPDALNVSQSSTNPKSRLSLLKSKLRKSDASSPPPDQPYYPSGQSYTAPLSAPAQGNSSLHMRNNNDDLNVIKRVMSHNPSSGTKFGLSADEYESSTTNTNSSYSEKRSMSAVAAIGGSSGSVTSGNRPQAGAGIQGSSATSAPTNSRANNSSNSNSNALNFNKLPREPEPVLDSNVSHRSNEGGVRRSRASLYDTNSTTSLNNIDAPKGQIKPSYNNYQSTPDSSARRDPGQLSSRDGSRGGERSGIASPRGGFGSPHPTDTSHYTDDAGQYEEGMDEVPDLMNQQQCPDCGRKFNPVPYAKHVKVCAKVFQKSRRVFDSAKMRIQDNPELVKILTQKKKAESKPNSKATNNKTVRDDRPIESSSNTTGAGGTATWKSQSEAFREAMRAARQVSKAIATGAPLPPPVASAPDPSLILCQNCGRRFNAKAAERHIPMCANIQAKPSALKKGTGGIKGGTAVVKSKGRF